MSNMDIDYKKRLMVFLQASIGTSEIPVLSADDYVNIYKECKAHAIIGLPVNILSRLNDMPTELMTKWKKDILALLYAYTQYVANQDTLIRILKDHDIDFVILKGTAASQYYTTPEIRVMGDIDIMPKREQFEKTCSVLIEAGYSKIAYYSPYKCMVLRRNNTIIEVHRYFARMNDIEKAEILDNMIVDNIRKESCMLPDAINGLVLLQHVDHHLENGIGLRQIIDWQMFVDRYLSDEKWNDGFRDMVRAIGLEDLAKVLTRMCQLYLGLRDDIMWCMSANKRICDQLLEYVFDCGNFGSKIDKGSEAINTALGIHNQFRYFHRMQEYGLIHLKEENKKWPRQLAWFYQIIRFFRLVCNQGLSVSDVVRRMEKSRQRRKLFKKLNINQEMKGIAVYKGGEFVKE